MRWADYYLDKKVGRYRLAPESRPRKIMIALQFCYRQSCKKVPCSRQKTSDFYNLFQTKNGQLQYSGLNVVS